MAITQLVYASRPFGFDQAVLSAILVTARANNNRDGISGALICRADLYLQYLEGDADMIAACYGRIARDDRHLEVTKLVHKTAPLRLFPTWAMKHDPAESWLWTKAECDAGALTRASEAEVLGVFERLAG
jgi:Sensors of blue-light using FAD